MDVGAYAPLSSDRRYKLAVWTYADLVVDGVAPYFDLPSTAGDSYGRSGRGYAEGHFRGEKLAFVELEYGAPLMRNEFLRMVAFVSRFRFPVTRSATPPHSSVNDTYMRRPSR